GFAESFAGAVDQDALPLPAGPLLSAVELAAAAAAARARVVLASPVRSIRSIREWSMSVSCVTP
ncbi:MAG TPA: hypothetical protein VFA63_05325, partial [Pseudonocardiaceae bacterium]|nr:hypothetical protein [Pseudonocardiaceae bacterium]